ncbi:MULTISPECIES: TonB-dependent siderophore receptor [unclassified Yoonia]|uniref:TonB-dependent siderophore receptor n=1 Tax=unclassified Yoonia TaxID=2629118 RepID=UPI002AFF6CC1|nr:MULTISPECIES: TonB-dependent siderophore receptor [unclassified Yoonia]
MSYPASILCPLFRGHALILGCTALTLLPVAASAQDDSSFRLSPIIVQADAVIDDDANAIVAQEMWTGGKVATSILDTPASVSVVTAKEIEMRNADTVETVLQYTPGIHTDYYGSDDRNDYVLVRGFQATSYRDGMTLGSMRDIREDPFAYARVEAIRGANSTLFGVSDPGGSINFVTKQPQFERFGEAYSTIGSHDHAELGVDFGDTLNASGTLAYRLTAKVQDSGQEYDTGRDNGTLLMGGLTWQPSDATALTIVVDQLTRDATPNSGGYPLQGTFDRENFFGDPNQNDHDVDRKTASAFLRHAFNDNLNLRANLRYSDLTDSFGYVYLAEGTGPAGMVYDRDFYGQDRSAQELVGNVILQYDAQFAAFDSSTLAGLEYRDAQSTVRASFADASPIDITNPVNAGAAVTAPLFTDEDRDYRTRSAFLQQNLSFDDRFIATVGVRRDWLDLETTSRITSTTQSDDFAETSWRGALTYKITPEISTYASYVESVAPPSIGVAPERGEQYEIGVKYQPSGMDALISAAVFDLTKDNVSVPVVQDNGSIVQELIGESHVTGFEVEGKAALSNRVEVIAGYSYIDTEVVRGNVRGRDVSGNEFATVPNHTASLWLNYTRPAGDVVNDQTFGIGARYVGDYFYGIPNGDKAEAAVIVDASYSYAFDQGAELALNVSNLFDEQHVVGSATANYYNPGRSIALTMRQSW